MIKAQYIAISDTGEHHTIYAIDLEEAIKIFRHRNIHGKCKQLGTDHWTEIERTITMTENKTSKSQLRAVRKYKEKVNRITIDFHPSEAEMWEHLQSQPKKATYIKNLIKKNMKGE